MPGLRTPPNGMLGWGSSGSGPNPPCPSWPHCQKLWLVATHPYCIGVAPEKGVGYGDRVEGDHNSTVILRDALLCVNHPTGAPCRGHRYAPPVTRTKEEGKTGQAGHAPPPKKAESKLCRPLVSTPLSHE